ncbi:ABC transporter permease [Aureimonas fodinaquatilis]|uniref:ABC transporter permease n=1 Tax=Aureimonas fodinaquatilis TaxID=2565783 RepID=A0A5B0DUH4_9HYPH|nr:ABC transporter permease [Aureimonas fodinaquatilis]KAA0970424.1 ABC transporter permease [Aureimonas fodinaquatilis]
MRKLSSRLLASSYWTFILYLSLPLAMMILMSFKDSRFIGFPINAWTTDWYLQVFRDGQMMRSMAYTTFIAVVSMVLTLLISIWTAMFMGPFRFRGKMLVFALLCLPAVMPGIISAISLRIFIRSIGMEPGVVALIMGQVIHNVPFATLMLLARLGSLPTSQIEAARDLGSSAWDAFRRITIPYLTPAIFGAATFCMLLSYDDFVRAFFLGGYEPTLMVLLFAKLRAGMSPEINAISTIVLVLTAVVGIWAERASRRNKGTAR